MMRILMNTTSIKYTLAILLAPLAAHAQRTPSPTATSIQPAPTAPLGKKWKLAFSDEFDGTAIGGTKWKPINNADWVHPDFKTRQAKENCALDGQGHLVIRVSRDADADGRIQSVQLFAKGYLRAESKLDTPQADQSFTLSNLFEGDNTVIATAVDNDGHVGLSAPLRVKVTTPVVPKTKEAKQPAKQK